MLRVRRGGGLAAPPEGPRNCPQRVPSPPPLPWQAWGSGGAVRGNLGTQSGHGAVPRCSRTGTGPGRRSSGVAGPGGAWRGAGPHKGAAGLGRGSNAALPVPPTHGEPRGRSAAEGTDRDAAR